MKHAFLTLTFLVCSLTAQAELSLTEIRTASNNVVVAYFKSDIIKADEVVINDVSQWRINGRPVTAINRFVTEADACDHHIYLRGPTLVNGKHYTLQTPHGNMAFTFDDRKTFCESIKTNQNAYSALSKVRYANFAIWLGDGGRGTSVTDIQTMPRERRFIDNLPSIQWTEFTVYQSLCFPAAVYPVLANGGTWDNTNDPFVSQQE